MAVVSMSSVVVRRTAQRMMIPQQRSWVSHPHPLKNSSRTFSSSNKSGNSVVPWKPFAIFAVAGAIGFGAMAIADENLAKDGDEDKQSTYSGSGPVPPSAEITSHVFFDVAINGTEAGRVVMGLYGTVVPKTVQNFETLCRGDTMTQGNHRQIKLAYAGSAFHRIIPKFMIQGGDFTHHNGMGGMSIFGTKTFADENFKLTHTGPGVLSMANAGPHTNGSQFFICTAKTSHLDGRHVVFGVVTDGWDVVQRIESYGSRSGTPSAKISILRAGILPPTTTNDETDKTKA